LTRPNQMASHVSKNRELWLPFLPRLMSKLEARTGHGQGDGCVGRGFSLWVDLVLAHRTRLNPWLSGFMQPSISSQYP